MQEVGALRGIVSADEFDCFVGAARFFSDDQVWLSTHHRSRRLDVVLPWPNFRWDPANENGKPVRWDPTSPQPEAHGKDFLAFFAGGSEGKTCVRSVLFNYYGAASKRYLDGSGTKPSVLVVDNVHGNEFDGLRDRSLFCVSPAG